MLLAIFGPFGLAILATLNDRVPSQTDRYARFIANMNWLVRTAYEVCTFLLICALAWQGMLLYRMLIIRYQVPRA